MPIKNYQIFSLPIALIVLALSLSITYAQTDTTGTSMGTDSSTTTPTNPTRNQINQDTKTAIQAANKTRQQTIKELTEARKAKFEELRRNHQENSTVRQEKVKENFSQAQLASLQKIKGNMSINGARFSKAVEHLYFVADRLDSYLQEQKDAGFDVATKEAQLDAIQVKIVAFEKQVDDLNAKYKDLESLKGEEIRAKMPEIKADVAKIVVSYKDIKTDLVAMMKGLR